MRIYENGIYRDATEEEKLIFGNTEQPTFEERVVNRIREFYSIDDELAILRQRDTKPEEFAEYNDFVEKVKEEERNV